MKSKLFFLAICLFFIDVLHAQTLDWAKMYGGPDSLQIYSSATDNYGNTYVSGTFVGTIDLDPGPGTYLLTNNSGVFDIFICKFDINGIPVWAFKYDNGIYTLYLDVDQEGNIYASGSFGGNVDFDPGINSSVLSAPFAGVFILKLNSIGVLQWARKSNATGNSYYLRIKNDPTGGVVFMNTFNGQFDIDPGPDTSMVYSDPNGYGLYVCKYDENGNFVYGKSILYRVISMHWENLFLTVDKQGNAIMSALFSGTQDIDPGPGVYNLTASGAVDHFILKLNNIGDFVWAKRFSDPSDYSRITYIRTDNDQNIIYGGTFINPIDFDLGSGTYNLSPQYGLYIFISKMDANGNFIWAKQIGGLSGVWIYNDLVSLTIDEQNSIYLTGKFNGDIDFDPGLGQVSTPISYGYFIEKLDENGNYQWNVPINNDIERWSNFLSVNNNTVSLSGGFRLLTDFDSESSFGELDPNNSKLFIAKYKQKCIKGVVLNDLNQNCTRDIYEYGIMNRHIKIMPGNIFTQTNSNGFWVIDSLPIGTYTATIDASGNWQATCPVVQSFTVTNLNEITYAPDFGLVSTQPCASPDVSIIMPFIRPCFNNQIVYVNASNRNIATGILNNAYVDIELDSLITPQTASLAYTNLGNNKYRFQLGTMNPGQYLNFTINCNVSCNAVLGQTLCIHANIFPADTCVFDTIPSPFPGNFTPCTLPWDHSSLQVDGYCNNDSIFFIVTNTGQFGNGDMDCYSPVRIYIDGVWMILDSIQLTGGDTAMFVFPGDGRTWRLEADQHPLHPGNSHPNATIEACGDTANWTPGLVNILPHNDADPVVDIYCGVVTGSYDPNDKTGYPTGVTTEHNIMPNQQLQYVIRFQNTGTDTAFKVVVRDTLDLNLDIFSVTTGVASHNYNFQMYGPRVLEWTFYNILLPDSGHSEAESHGFVTFTVNQNHNLANNTKIYNSADIYFDFNAPVETNQTMHTIYDGIQTVLYIEPILSKNTSLIKVYPNPTSTEIYINLSTDMLSEKFSLIDIYGREILNGILGEKLTKISVENLAKGIYILQIIGDQKASFKIVKE